MIQLFKEKIKNLDPIDFSLILSVFFIITHFQKILSNNPFIFVPFLILGAIGILFQESRQSKWYWVLLSILYFIWVSFNWQNIDNHIYLWGYWILSIAISFFTKDQKRTLKLSAQFLIATCMGFASYQKLNSTFTSGDFFYFTLITDHRFFFIGPLIDFNMIEVIKENNLLLDKMKSYSKNVIFNPGPFILHPISKFLTWYVILLEVLLSIIFFLPRKIFYKGQHWLLFVFFSVYLLLPIRGFAFTLIAMGVTLIKKDDYILKSCYIAFIIYMFALSDVIVDYFFNQSITLF